jgi:hypothetical protein
MMLEGVGVNVNTLIEKMGPSMNDFVNTAVAAGATIPEAMRPSLDAMYKAGQLLHEDGTAYTEAEYKALKFGQTQEEMFNTLIEKIDKMVSALLGIPDVDYNVTQHNRTVGEGGAGDGGDGEYPRGRPPGMARGDIVTSPTLAMIGEGGESEIVMSTASLAAMRRGGGRNEDAIVRELRELRSFLPDAMMRAMRTANALRPTQ